MTIPKMSVILITPDGYLTLRRTVRALREQTVHGQLELIIVAPEQCELKLIPSELTGFACYQIVRIENMDSTAAARAAGVRAAKARIVAFGEDHCSPAPGWAEALIARHRESWSGVGPAIGNANPRSAISWANFLIEYGDWIDPRPGEARHIPGHNGTYKRDALLEYGAALADILEAESVMQWDMQTRGHRFCMEPAAKAWHLNFSLFRCSVWLRFHGGRIFASNRCLKWSWARRTLYALSSPLIPAVRLRRILAAWLRSSQRPKSLALLPSLLVLLVADALGELLGYTAGGGESMAKISGVEFHRERFTLPSCRSNAFGEQAQARKVA